MKKDKYVKEPISFKFHRMWWKVKRLFFKVQHWFYKRKNRKWTCGCCTRKRNGERKYYVEKEFICGDCKVIQLREGKLNPYYEKGTK